MRVLGGLGRSSLPIGAGRARSDQHALARGRRLGAAPNRLPQRTAAHDPHSNPAAPSPGVHQIADSLQVGEGGVGGCKAQPLCSASSPTPCCPPSPPRFAQYRLYPPSTNQGRARVLHASLQLILDRYWGAPAWLLSASFAAELSSSGLQTAAAKRHRHATCHTASTTHAPTAHQLDTTATPRQPPAPRRRA
jgi:hypothetical protein